MKYLILALSFLFAQQTMAIDKHDITITVDNYDQKEIIVGYYFGDKTLILDTLVSESNKFELRGDSLLNPGVYLLLTVPNNEYIQFLINPEDQVFDMKLDATDMASVKFKGCADNELFYDYLAFIQKQRQKSGKIEAQKADYRAAEKDTSALQQKLIDLDLSVQAKQDDIIAKHPETISALLLSGNKRSDIPDFEGTEDEIKEKKFQYYKAHYFDFLDFQNKAIIRTPFFHKRVDGYLNKLTMQIPDSVIQSTDYLLDNFKGNTDLYKFYLSNFLNSYAKIKIVGMDAVYVHIAQKYYANGEADWVDEESLGKILQNARKLKPILIGKTAPDFTIYREDGSEFALSDVDTEYTLLFFWAPDCGHCKKAIPFLKDFQSSSRAANVTMLTICNQQGENYQKCWDAVQEKGLQDFINLGDQNQKSRILSKYYVTTTPKIFILDRDKEILVKNISAEGLANVFEQLEKIQAEKATLEETK